MNYENNNLLINLSKWAKRHKENFTTEAFAHLLRYLKKDEPTIAYNLLKKMTSGEVNLAESDIQHLTFNMQKTRSGVKPDIEIVSPDHLIFIEVKVAAELGDNQLNSYQQALAKSGVPNRKLILLSRIPSTKPDSRQADIAIRWYQMAQWLEDELENGNTINETSKYVIKQFIEFLHGDNLAIKPIKENIINEFQKMLSLQIRQGDYGIKKLEELLDYPTLYSLLMMMDQVIDSQYRRTLVSGALVEGKYIGYDIQNSQYFFYLHFYGRECKLIFMTWDIKIDVEQSNGTFGQVIENAGPIRWQNELILSGPIVRFFSASKSTEDQIQIINEFYRKNCQFVQRMIL